jgi:hypothetical protein
VTREEWRYIIPRPFLDALAATMTLGRSTQVTIALLCKLYGDQANAGSETPEGTVTVSALVKLTGRGSREVEKAVAILRGAGVLVDVDAQPGRATVRRINPRPKWAPPEVGGGGVKVGGGSGQIGRGFRPDRAGVPPPRSGGPTYKEQKNLLKEPSKRTLDFAEVEGAGAAKAAQDGRPDPFEQARKARAIAAKAGFSQNGSLPSPTPARRVGVDEVADVLRRRGEGMTSGEIAAQLHADPKSVYGVLGHNDRVFKRIFGTRAGLNVYSLREQPPRGR